jgi:hypothetical protein
VLFKTPKKTNKPTVIPQGGEENPSTACRYPKKRHLISMRGITGIQLIRPLFVILIVGIILIPFIVDQNNNPAIFNLQTEVQGQSSVIPECGAVLDIVSTSDGGSAFLTFLKSEGDIPLNERIYLTKTDIDGTVIWSVSFRDLVMFDPFFWCMGSHYHVRYGVTTDNDIEPTNLIQTSDNGFLFSGRSKTNPADMCLIKTDKDGNLFWMKSYQIKPNQRGCTIVDLIEANEGGYAFILETWINQEDVTESWLVKTDTNGEVQWYKSFEETEDDGKLITLIQTAENGYCLLGKSDIYYDDELNLPGFKSKETALYSRINLIKTDEKGNLEWLKNIDRIVIPTSSIVVKQTEKEEFILSGYFINEKTLGLMKLSTDGEQVIWENSFILDTSINKYKRKYPAEFSNSLLTLEGEVILLIKQFDSDMHLISFTEGGVKKWEKTYEDLFPFIDNTKDMNLVMGGVCDLTTCVMKINTTGSPIWKRIYHPPNDTEIVTHVLSSTDGGVILYGITNSFGAGKYDLWLLKTNSYGDLEWQKTFGSQYDEYPISILESKDGGYFFVGQIDVKSVFDEAGSIIFGKITNNGDLAWNLSIDFSNGTGDQEISFIKQTTDEGYIIGGISSLSTDGDCDSSWILKLNKHGFIQWKKDYRNYSPPIQTHDEGFILISEADSESDGTTLTISKLDISGESQWEWDLPPYLYGNATITQELKLISTPSAYFLFLFSLFPPENINQMEMVKLNFDGEMEWKSNLGESSSGWEKITFVREINDGYLVHAHWEDKIIKFNFQGRKVWEKEYLSYFYNFNNSESHLLFSNDYVLSKITNDEVQNWITDTQLTPIEVSRWAELSNGNIVILREDYESTFRDLHIINKTETNLCTPNFINNSFTTSVRTIVATPDGGCVVAGEKILTTDHTSIDVYLLKLSNNGLVEWIQTYAGRENQIKGFLIEGSFTVTPSTTPIPGWGPISLLVVAVVLITWYKRRKKLG